MKKVKVKAGQEASKAGVEAKGSGARARLVQNSLTENKLVETIRKIRRIRTIISMEETKCRSLIEEAIKAMEELGIREIQVDNKPARLDVFEVFSLDEEELVKFLKEMEERGIKLDVTEEVFSKEKVAHCIERGDIPEEVALRVFQRKIQKRFFAEVKPRSK